MKGAQRRVLEARGVEVTVRNYTRSTSDGRESWSETAGSPHTLTALVDPTRAPRPERDAYDAGEVAVQRSFHIETGTTAESNTRDGGGEGATEVDYDGQTWVVLQLEARNTGLTELICERDD